jgi:hypothetical protein
VHAGCCFADLDGSYNVRVLHALTIAGFANEALNGSAVLAELFTKNLHGDRAVIGMMRPEDGGSSALANLALQRISGDGLTYEILAWHAANLIPPGSAGKRNPDIS